MTARLPIPGGDDGQWGDILNAYLEVSLNSDGTIANNTIGTNQLQNNAVTNAQVSSSIQTSLSKANSSEQTANKGAAGGYASLDGSALLPVSQLPSSVATGSPTGGLPVWASGTAYALNEAVAYAGNAFLCNTAHTSASTFSADSTNWTALGNAVPADYTIWTLGTTIYATPLLGSANPLFSGTDAYTVIQDAITQLTPTGGGLGSGGGKIHITQGTYNLSNELTITGWENATYNPYSQLVITGDGWSTIIYQHTSGKNALVVKNGASVALTDFRITVGQNANSCLLADDSGTNIECGMAKSYINNLHCDSTSTGYPAVLLKNIFYVEVPKLEVISAANSGLVIQNTSTTTNYGNSHFGLLHCRASTSSPYAGLAIETTQNSRFPNLITVDNFECPIGYYGLYTFGARSCTINFCDIESQTYPIWMDGNASGAESRNNNVMAGYVYPGSSGADTAITLTEYSGGNYFGVYLQMAASGVPISDSSSTYRPANSYNVGCANKTAVGLISILNPNAPVTVRNVDGTVEVLPTPAVSIAPTTVTATNASLAVPTGAGHAKITAVGGGGGGGGGGSLGTSTVTTTLTNGNPSGTTLAVQSPGLLQSITSGQTITVNDGVGHTQAFTLTATAAAAATSVSITSATVTLNTGSGYAAYGSTWVQVGGGGGGAGQVTDALVSLSGISSLSVTIGVGGAGGGGGAAAASGNIGSAASNTPSQSTTVTASGISITAYGGGQGRGAAASSATTANAGIYGAQPTSGQTANGFFPGCGSFASSIVGSGGGAAIGIGGRGGGGGCPSTTTLGGAAGSATNGTGTTVTSTGATAANATANTGQGGDGGGGGALGGAGGAGGAGGSGFVVIEWLP